MLLIYEFCTESDLIASPSYKFCGGEIENEVGARFKLKYGTTCHDVHFDTLRIGNPDVFFDALNRPTNPVVTLDGHAIEIDTQYYSSGIAQELLLEKPLSDPACLSVPNVTGMPPYEVVGTFNNRYWIHDPRFSLFDNTVESPKADGGGAIVRSTESSTISEYRTRCANVEMNFLNEESCFLSSDPDVCSGGEEMSGSVTLTFANFEKVFQASIGKRYIYAVDGLRQDNAEAPVPYDFPCTATARSRWVKVNDCSFNTPSSSTSQIFADLIGSSTDTNPYLRDVLFPATGDFCDPGDRRKFNFRVSVHGECWQNVHQDHLQVFDFTDWVDEHPNGAASIQQFAVPGSFTIYFPSSHPMSRWYVDGKGFRKDLGRLYDEADIDASPHAAAAFSDVLVSPDIDMSGVVCGSPDEVANLPQNAGSLHRGAFDGVTAYNRTTPFDVLANQRVAVWMSVVLQAKDQLRQKVAWALSQLIVVSPASINVDYTTEKFLVS